MNQNTGFSSPTGPSPAPNSWQPAEPNPAPQAPPPPPPVQPDPIPPMDMGPAPDAGSNPFETSPNPVPPISGPMEPVGGMESMEPKQKSSLPLIIVLVILIILGGLFLASWLGWIDLGLNNLWGGSKIDTTAPEPVQQTTNVNDAKRKEDLASVKEALRKYYIVNQKYPTATGTEKLPESAALKQALVPDYISALPSDPASPSYYYGYKCADGTSYELTAVLEDLTDPSGVVNGSVYLYILTDKVGDNSIKASTGTEPAGLIETTETTTTTTGGTTSNSATSTSTSTSGTGANANATANTQY